MKLNTIKEHYKKTKLGKIPKDWAIKKGEEITVKITKGTSPKWQGFDYQESGILFVTSENVRDGYLRIDQPKYLPKEFNEKQRNSQLKHGDLLINIVGASIGRSCEYSLYEEANINQAVCLFRAKSAADKEFIKYYLQSDSVVKRLLGTQTESARPNLSLTDIRNFEFILPSSDEEKVQIASILSTWDKSIELKEKLIEQKKEQKKGLMQKLLLGEVRLPGYDAEWKKIKIGELITESKVVADTPDLNKRITVRLNLKGVQKREVSAIEKVDATTQYIRRAGQFIYGKQNLHKGALGLVPKELDGFQSSSDIPSFDFESGVDGLWFYYYISRESFYTYLEVISTGTGSKRINPKDLYKVKIKVPPFEEQQRISKILFCIDEEIKLNEKELEELRKQKKGLMQLLLTGKVRVKV